MTNTDVYCTLEELAETTKRVHQAIKELARQQGQIADILTKEGRRKKE